jgi:hypothetical protein
MGVSDVFLSMTAFIILPSQKHRMRASWRSMTMHMSLQLLLCAVYTSKITRSHTISLDTTSFPKLRSILCNFAEERLQENLVVPTS